MATHAIDIQRLVESHYNIFIIADVKDIDDLHSNEYGVPVEKEIRVCDCSSR